MFVNSKTDFAFNDFAFKKIFGSPQSHDIVLSFLNKILYECSPNIHPSPDSSLNLISLKQNFYP
ncbi:MAG: PD-(D/E)XK nuclease family transposase [Phormidesmis sp.]